MDQQQQFLLELGTIVEVDGLRPDQPLTDGNWDSVALLSTIALVDGCFDVSVSGAELSRCTTPQDILNLIDKTKGAQ